MSLTEMEIIGGSRDQDTAGVRRLEEYKTVTIYQKWYVHDEDAEFITLSVGYNPNKQFKSPAISEHYKQFAAKARQFADQMDICAKLSEE